MTKPMTLNSKQYEQLTRPELLDRGARVHTPHGYGLVRYVRMAPPDYNQAEAYSVLLDDRDGPHYSGTIFPAAQVTRAKANR